MTTVGEIISRIEEFAPPHLAEDWDPIGLSIGRRDQPVQKMMVALDLDANTLQEAKAKEVDFLFTHHPAIFSPLKTLNEEDSRRKEYIELIRSDISLYSAHTNIDAATNGMNDWLAEALGLEKPYRLMDYSYEDSFKLLTIESLKEELDQIAQKLAKIAAGELVHYNPHIDQPQRTKDSKSKYLAEQPINKKAEFVIPSHLVCVVKNELSELNLKKDTTFYWTAIEKEAKTYGIGRIGTLAKSTSVYDIIKQVKSAYSIENLRVANIDLNQQVQTVAVLGGSGEKYYKQALAQGAELYITGDISYHGAQDMIREGLAFIDAGHFIENIFVDKMTEMLNEWNEQESWGIEIVPSTHQKDVFQFQ